MKTWYKVLTTFAIDLVAPAFGALLVLWIVWNVETRYAPVIKDFKVLTAKVQNRDLIVSGTMDKNRSCELVNLSLYTSSQGNPRTLLSQFKKEIFGADAGTGVQNWGPFAFAIPPNISTNDRIEVIALHRCHALWLQQTVYLDVKFQELVAKAKGQ